MISRRTHRGYSLIEILLAVGVLSFVMTAIAMAMLSMYQVDQTLKENVAYDRVIPRLSLQLRTDAHRAVSVASLEAADSAGIVLTFEEGEQITYQAAAGRLIRLHQRDAESLGREVFHLGPQTKLDWQMIESDPPLVELQLVRSTGEIDSLDSQQVDRVLAVIGIRNRQDEKGAADDSVE